MINRVYRCRMIAIVIWSLFQVTTVIGQASQNQLPDGKLCLFTCSEWIFEEKVAQFAPSANLLGPGQLSKHTIGLPCDHGSDSQTSSNGPNYHNVWGAVYIIDKNECDAVIKQSQSEYETPFLSNEDVIVVKHGEMNCLTVDLGIQPGDHPPRHHPNNILPNTNQDEAYYEQLAKLGVPQDYINGLQLASQRNRHHPIIPRDYHPARYNKKPNSAPNNQLPNQISGQQNDVLPSVTVKVPHQQNLYPNQGYVEITPLELPGGEDEPISFQRTSPQVPEVNQRPNQRKVISQKPMQLKPYSSEESSEEEEEPELTSVQPNPTKPSRSIKNAPAPINLQKPVQSAPNLTENTPKLIPAQPSNPLPEKFIPNAQKPIIENTQPKLANYSPAVTQKLVDRPVNENYYGTPEVGQPIELRKSSDSPRPLVIPQTARRPKISQSPIVQSSTPKVIPASNTSNVSSPPISLGTTPKSVSSAKDTENVPLTNNEVDEAPSVVVITPFKNPRMVATPADANQNQPYERTQSLKPQNNVPKSGVLGFPKSNDSPTLTTQQGRNPTVLSPTTDSTTPTVVINPNHPVSENNGGDKTPSIVTVQNPITDTKTPTVLVNPNHLVSGSPRGKTPTVLISPNESSPKVNVLDEQQPQVISPEVKLPHNPNSSPTISPDQNGGNLSGPNLPPNFIIRENLSVLPDEPMFIPNNEDSVPSILADFATTDIFPELPDQPMFLPEDEFYERSLPSDFGTKNNLRPQPNQPTSISTENNSLLPLLSDFSTTDTPTLLPDQPMFIPEENNSLHSIPPHIATTEKPESLPDEPMFIPDDNIQDNTTKHVPQQVNPSSPVITPSHPHPTGYIPKSILDEEHAQKNNDSPVVQNPPQASKIKPLPQRNEQLVKPIIPDTTDVSKVPSDSNIQPYATGLLPKSTDDHPAQSLKPATPVKVLDTPIVVVEPTPTKQPHATGFKPEIADTDIHPTQPILLKSPDENRTPIQPSTIKQPRNEVSLNQDTPLIASTPSTTTNDQPHATGFKPEIAEKDTRPTQHILPAPINVKQPSNEVPPVTNTQPNTTGVVLKPTVEKENNPVEPVQSVTPVKQKPSQQVIPPSSSQVHTTGLQPKLAKDQSSGPAQPVQPVIPVKQSSLPSNTIESQPKSIRNQDNPVSSEEQVPITIPQDNQNSGSSSNYDPSTFMVPNYSPDSSFLGYTFGTYFPQYIQKYDPQYEPSNCVYSPEEFVPGFTFGGHCQLY